LTIVATGLTTLGVVAVAWLTRRTAKDQTAVGGFTALVKTLQEQNDRQENRIAALEKQASSQRQLEAKRHRAMRAHERWDRLISSRMQQLTDEAFPDPPPLDVEV